MNDKIKELITKLTDKTWKKCLIIFIIIFMVLVGVGVTSVNYLTQTIADSNIDIVTTTVIDKIDGDNLYNNYYLIITENNQTFSIEDTQDGYGKKMFDKIKIGEKYKFVIRHPDITDSNQFTHILQVQNGTS